MASRPALAGMAGLAGSSWPGWSPAGTWASKQKNKDFGEKPSLAVKTHGLGSLGPQKPMKTLCFLLPVLPDHCKLHVSGYANSEKP